MWHFKLHTQAYNQITHVRRHSTPSPQSNFAQRIQFSRTHRSMVSSSSHRGAHLGWAGRLLLTTGQYYENSAQQFSSSVTLARTTCKHVQRHGTHARSSDLYAMRRSFVLAEIYEKTLQVMREHNLQRYHTKTNCLRHSQWGLMIN